MPRDEQQLKRTAAEIREACDEVCAMLLEKNAKYGDSALDPRRIFSKADPVEQIKVRIDDKLSRAEQMDPGETEDVEKDLIGYLVLLRIARKRSEKIVGRMPSGTPVKVTPIRLDDYLAAEVHNFDEERG